MLPAILIFLFLFSSLLPGREVHITILATTDLHGHVYPYDYLSGKPAERGLAKIATLIARERATSPSALLVDTGDTIQGASLETLWQSYAESGKLPMNLKFAAPAPTVDPMMLTMNALRFDAMALGNHEFNYGLKNLKAARSAARFPWLSANVSGFDPWLLKEIDGVKVALVGLTTPVIPLWEKPDNIAGITFSEPIAALRRTIATLKAQHKPDLIVVLAHSGLDRDLATGAPRNAETPGENVAYQIAMQVPGVDALLFGHTHLELPEARVNSVLLTQPKNWGSSLARVDFTMESTASGWTKKASSSRTIPVTKDVVADATLLNLAKPYHDMTEKWLNSEVARAATDLTARTARIEDTALIDAIHQVQLHYAKADVSLAAAFNLNAKIAAGPVTIRQIASLYVYDNELYAVEGNGKMLREALENGARIFRSCADAACKGPLINAQFPGFNFDMAQGVTYDIDLTQPEGKRIRNLRYKGAPLSDTQPLRIAMNNYRAGGSGGFDMFRGAKVVWQSHEEIRNLMIRYYGSHPLPSKPDGNWKVVPEAARLQLQSDVNAGVGRPMNQ